MIKDYTSLLKIAWRIFRQTPLRLLWKICWNFGWRNLWHMRRFKRQMKEANRNGSTPSSDKSQPSASNSPKSVFPAFVMVSVTEACNLQCSGCWVSAGGRKALSLEQLDGIVTSCKAEGSYFFGILGGEPLMYKGLMDVLKKHSDCYFQLFTNGTLLTDEVAMELRQLGNVTPLVSVEGLKDESDRRRGRNEVYERSLRGIRACRKAGLIFGVAASICKTNYDELVCREHIERVAKEGAAYLWYYIYRPVGANPQPEVALDKEQIRRFREFVVEERRNAPVVIIDTYWDDKGQAMCPAATAMSHHISPSGALEFCPPLQLAKEFIGTDGLDTAALFRQSQFLADLRRMTAQTSRGCILLEDPQRLATFLKEHEAVETTTRATALQEYETMRPQAGHDMGNEAIPEKSAPYRWLKRNYFFGFGVYG